MGTGERCEKCARPVWDGGHGLNERECNSEDGIECRIAQRALAAEQERDEYKLAYRIGRSELTHLMNEMVDSPLVKERDDLRTALADRDQQIAALKEKIASTFNLVDFYDAKAIWSFRTFGPGDRYQGVIAHIRKELVEIEKEPSDLEEWVDVVLLAMDGAFRSAKAIGLDFARVLQEKQRKNEARTWPDWRTLKPGEVSEHVRERAICHCGEYVDDHGPTHNHAPVEQTAPHGEGM